MSEPMAESTPPNRSGRLPLIAALGLVVVVIIGAAVWAVIRSDAPAAVDLDAATAELTGSDSDDGDSNDGDSENGGVSEPADTTDADEADSESNPDDGETESPDPAATVSDVSGVWTIDTSIGEFSFENSTGTYVGFRVKEELTTVGATEAVGRTPDVIGSVTIEGQTVTAVEIEADMTAITTDVSRRDGAARRALDTSNFPTATFVLTEPIDLGADPASGDPISTTAVGDLTIHGETNTVELAIDAQLVGDTIAVVGTTDVVFADYGIATPSAVVVVRLDDFGVIEFQLFLTRT